MTSANALFLLVLGAAIVSLGNWPATFHSMARSSGYTFVTKLMYGLCIIHFVIAAVIVVWLAPIRFSFQAIVDSWRLIGTAAFFSLLGARYWQTARWAQTRGERRKRIGDSIRAFSRSLP